MRKPILLLLSLCGLMTLTVGAQQAGSIDAALQKGNAPDLGIHLASSVDLSIPGADDNYSADKVVTLLSDFFTRVTIKGYKRLHLTNPQDGRSHYSIGELYTAQGTHRITLYFNSDKKITELKIQK